MSIVVIIRRDVHPASTRECAYDAGKEYPTRKGGTRRAGDEVLQKYESEPGATRDCYEDLEDIALWIPVTDATETRVSKTM